MDILMALTVNTDPPVRAAVLPLQLYEIDEATYREWGSPIARPRDSCSP